MGSPHIETCFLFNIATGAPLSGQSSLMSFSYYGDDLGNAITAPTITEIGTSGIYKFTPVFTDPSRCICYTLSTGTGANPVYLTRQMRPEDWNGDNTDVASSTLATSSEATTITSAIASVQTDTTTIINCELGDEVVVTSGGDINRLVKYEQDHTTVIKKFDLTDANGTPTTTDPYSKVGV